MDRKEKSIHHEARKIDLDILLFDQELVNNEKLYTEENVELHINLPHVRLSERLFVLKPLCDIDPEQEHYSRKSEKNKSFGEELFDNFIKTDNNPKAEFYHFEDYLNFQKEVNAITNLDYLNSILVFSAHSKPALPGEKEASQEKEQKEFFILDCKEFIVKQREKENE